MMQRWCLILAVVVLVIAFRACLLEQKGKVCVQSRTVHRIGRLGRVQPVFVCDRWERR